MGLETTVNFISDLNPLNPADNDPASQGDDHIRLVKRAVKNTFPNLDSAVTATPAKINQLNLVTGNLNKVNYLDTLTVPAATLNTLAAKSFFDLDSTVNTITSQYLDWKTAIDNRGIRFYSNTGVNFYGSLAFDFSDQELSLRASQSSGVTIPAGIVCRRSTGEVVLTGDVAKLPPTTLIGNVQVATVADAIGVNQTWQNVSSSRIVGALYRNNTGKPIQVTVNVAGGAQNVRFETSPDNITYTSAYYHSGDDQSGPSGIIVPTGHWYKLRMSSGTIGFWSELS